MFDFQQLEKDIKELEREISVIILVLESYKGEGQDSYKPTPEIVSKVIDKLLEIRTKLSYIGESKI